MSAIKYPFFNVFSRMNNSGVFLKDLKTDIKFFISSDFVEISKFSIENLLFINDSNDIWDLIFSNSILLFWISNFVPIVLIFNFKLNGSKTNLISLSSTFILLSISLTLFKIWLLNLSVSIPNILK